MTTTTKTTGLQALAEVMADILAADEHISGTTAVWNGAPDDVCEFTVTLTTGEKFNVIVKPTTPETEIQSGEF